jgi:HAMP domain-containing protein/signal transduction histidine kinase/DNA-binding response OmpR family regulator
MANERTSKTAAGKKKTAQKPPARTQTSRTANSTSKRREQRLLGPEPEHLDRRRLLAALRALRRGDFSARLPEGLDGLDGSIAEVLNDVMGQCEELEHEMIELRGVAGLEGRTRRRLPIQKLHGGWTTMAGAVNELLDDMTAHSEEVAAVVKAVSLGDLTKRVEIDAAEPPLRGDFLRHAQTVNHMVDGLSAVSWELIRVAQEVGVDGQLGAQAKIPGVSGTWRDLTESVNSMASNLTAQVREIARVTTAVANGDLTKSINIEVRGEILKLKNTINTMVEQLRSFADEVTRVAREVGTEGRLGGQARVHGVRGVWRELTENVNSMANNLTLQVRNIADVASAIAEGDLSKTITVEAQGEIAELKQTINTMVGQLSAFADEVTRVAREVGTDGVLGGQAEVIGVSGAWRELTENVNSMANNLTSQVRNIADVVGAIAEGDLSKTITVDAHGEILALKNTINSTVDKLNRFGAEVTRVARLVGTEGQLGAQAEVKDVSGIWRELTENVNSMANNLTLQVRNIADVTTAVANGDFSKKITVEVKGEILQLKNTVNAMVDSLGFFADEVTRMAREVGTEGVLGGQAEVRDIKGVWKELTDNVNSMADNLTRQVRNIAEVAQAVANGQLGKKITVDAQGEVQDLKTTINDMVDQLNAFSAEVTRIAREVGTEGKLGGQASVEGVRGTWKELTDNVNLMASNLTNQVRDIAEVTTAVANGDLSRNISVDARGEILELKNTINIMVGQLSGFADEVTRLAQEVGVEGKLGAQADVRGVRGTWRDLTDAVNSMASNLTDQVRSISQVATAIAQGDLERKITVDAKGEILELKSTINTTVDQLSSFADEVTRMAREVGTEGKLGGQASVEGVRGVWKDLTDNVNLMGSNLTNQVRDISQVATAIARGDLGRKVTVEVRGELLDLKNTINTMVDQLSSFADEVTQLARNVGVEGKLGGQAEVRGVSGIWKELTDNVNLMASNLTDQVRDIAQVTTSVARGDLSQKITVAVRGELLELKNTINTMVDQLSSFADEVTRVAREVGTEGMLGGQAQVRGVSGTWRELTDNVNVMARNLTEQVRGIARVVTAVARGNLKQELRLDAKGEVATLADTINDMIVTLSTFADQVTGVARDVGVEGRLGGQANVPGAAGIWRDLTDNVNELAGNLTRQVRAIGDVATAVTKGDLTQSIDVEARGELALLKDNLNQMIWTLAETTRVNEEQDWLKTNLTRFTRMLQGQRDLLTVARQVLSELAPTVRAQHGVFYMMRRTEGGEPILSLYASYAYRERKHLASEFKLGEGLVGQAALERSRILVTDVPYDYVRISSALGEARPFNIVVVPVLFESEVKGVIELATFDELTGIQLAFLEQLLESLGIVVATIEATMRTDELLRQSQTLAEELQTQQEELQHTNEELEKKARQLTAQKSEVERKNREVSLARQELEEKAEQLALTSRYKSEFLANMSHELRTPLNSLLILSRQLADNRNRNLDAKQIEYARTIHQAGGDLLELINEILDLAKIESRTMALEIGEVEIDKLCSYVERSFGPMAKQKGLELNVSIEADFPVTIVTDEMRLKQVVRNLLGNAIKFTDTGSVTLRMFVSEHEHVSPLGGRMVGFEVIDTGIGIAAHQHRIIFEAFQQADGSTARKYGGTGLGLSISRELTSLLGGTLTVESEVGVGSTFKLLLPEHFTAEAELPKSPRALPLERARPPSGPLTAEVIAKPRVPLRGLSDIPDDRDVLESGDRVVLIIEDDLNFAHTLLELAREMGFRGLVATEGKDGLSLARELKPDGISLDLGLPDLDGWVLLDRLKHDPETRHIPIHIVSATHDEKRALEHGARAFLHKPASPEQLRQTFEELSSFIERRIKRLLVVEDDDVERGAIVELIDAGDVEIVAEATAEAALATLRGAPFDCMVVDLTLPGMSGFELLEAINVDERLRRLPVIVYTGKALSEDETTALQRFSESVIIKDARSLERLLDETALFLHRVEAQLPEPKRRLLRSLGAVDPSLAERRVLVVDDDFRNVFAITALLEQHSMVVEYAENGVKALDKLAGPTRYDVVLMDIMMPEMDGYEAMRQIRLMPGFDNLPIIALTAKAMTGDRAKCIEAGASDYVTKPVDPDQLVSLLRVWLYR